MNKFLAIFSLALLASPVHSHSGGLNSEGCHNNRKTGDYHCHRAASPPQKASTPLQLVPSDEVYFFSCAEVREAGLAPLLAGQPGYASRLDRDNDGVACE